LPHLDRGRVEKKICRPVDGEGGKYALRIAITDGKLSKAGEANRGDFRTSIADCQNPLEKRETNRRINPAGGKNAHFGPREGGESEKLSIWGLHALARKSCRRGCSRALSRGWKKKKKRKTRRTVATRARQKKFHNLRVRGRGQVKSQGEDVASGRGIDTGAGEKMNEGALPKNDCCGSRPSTAAAGPE